MSFVKIDCTLQCVILLYFYWVDDNAERTVKGKQIREMNSSNKLGQVIPNQSSGFSSL